MPTLITSTLRKLLLLFALLNMLLFPVLFGLLLFAPDELRVLEPVVCPTDMRLERETSTRTDRQGTSTSVNVVCTNGQQKEDATVKMLPFMCGLPTLGGVLFAVWAVGAMRKQAKERMDLQAQD